MRDAPLTTIEGGINRLRTKGGARADTLYDLWNGYRLDSGEVQGRAGTRRHAKLDPGTRGLVSFGGSLHTFCHKAVYVPDGYTLNVLVPRAPDTTSAPTIIGGDWTTGADLDRYIGADPSNVAWSTFGRILDAEMIGDVKLVAIAGHSYDAGGTPPPEAGELIVYLSTTGNTPAPADAFTSVSFTDQAGASRTFTRVDAASPSGTIVGNTRRWVWTISPAAVLFAEDVSTVVTFSGLGLWQTGGEMVLPTLERIRFAEAFMGALYVAAEFSDGNVYHYWLQQGQQWKPGTVYKAGDIVYPPTPNGFVYKATRLGSPNPTWAPSALRFDGSGAEPQSVVEPTVYNDFYYRCVATSGVSPSSGTEEPTWPTEDGATVIESTDNPPDVTTPAATAVATVPNSVTKRYGRFLKGTVTR